MIDKFLRFRECKAWKILKILQEIVIVIAASATCLLFVVEVIARYILDVNFLGYDELVLLAVVWLYFIGGGYAMYKREHIHAEMIGLIFKGRALQISRVCTIWVTFLISLVLVKWGIDFMQYSIARPSNTTVLGIPRFYAQASLVIGYILVAFYSLIYAIEDTIKCIRKIDINDNTQKEMIADGKEECVNE